MRKLPGADVDAEIGEVIFAPFAIARAEHDEIAIVHRYALDHSVAEEIGELVVHGGTT